MDKAKRVEPRKVALVVDGEEVVMEMAWLKPNMWAGTCPYHDDPLKRFVVEVITQKYYCFTCGRSGEARLA